MYIFRSAHAGVTISTNSLSTGSLVYWESPGRHLACVFYTTQLSSYGLQPRTHSNCKLAFRLAWEQFYGVHFFLFHRFKQVAYFIQHKIQFFPCFKNIILVYLWGNVQSQPCSIFFSDFINQLMLLALAVVEAEELMILVACFACILIA